MERYFKFHFREKELQEEFLDTMKKIGFSTFSNANRTGFVYTVNMLQAVSVVRDNGGYNQALKSIENLTNMASRSKSDYGTIHNQQIIYTIFEQSGGNFKKLIDGFKHYMESFKNELEQYNVVWYAEFRPWAVGGK